MSAVMKLNPEVRYTEKEAIENSLKNSEETLAEIIQQLKVIEDIASKTDLLALNASIEAARVGKNGKGFTVVADEVSKLSEKTQKALASISMTIERLDRELKSVSSVIRKQK
ncbi:MAG TPA: methyl-accepting chemotaxis protein [Bacteriovoracaceae bacterium]|nr:methyl-accepting chemotaxis protein [Bacteriovoracaceae bacterium]